MTEADEIHWEVTVSLMNSALHSPDGIVMQGKQSTYLWDEWRTWEQWKIRIFIGRTKFQTNASFHFENKHCPLMILQLYMEFGKKLKPAAEPKHF